MNSNKLITMALDAGWSVNDGIITGGVSDLRRFANSVKALVETDKNFDVDYWIKQATQSRQSEFKLVKELIALETECKWTGLSTTEEELCISQSSSALEAVRNACDRLMEKNA